MTKLQELMANITRDLQSMKSHGYSLPIMPQSRRLSLRLLERIASYARQGGSRSKHA
jgi:hypothetical protein